MGAVSMVLCFSSSIDQDFGASLKCLKPAKIPSTVEILSILANRLVWQQLWSPACNMRFASSDFPPHPTPNSGQVTTEHATRQMLLLLGFQMWKPPKFIQTLLKFFLPLSTFLKVDGIRLNLLQLRVNTQFVCDLWNQCMVEIIREIQFTCSKKYN